MDLSLLYHVDIYKICKIVSVRLTVHADPWILVKIESNYYNPINRISSVSTKIKQKWEIALNDLKTKMSTKKLIYA